MKAEFDVQLQPKDLYRFNMFQTYTGMSGIISIALGILAFVMAGISAVKPDTQTGYLFMYIVMGLCSGFMCQSRFGSVPSRRSKVIRCLPESFIMK